MTSLKITLVICVVHNLYRKVIFTPIYFTPNNHNTQIFNTYRNSLIIILSNYIHVVRNNLICYVLTFVCVFVCLGFFISLENSSLIWRRHHCRWKAANFDLCSALMVIEGWGFFFVSHLLWHWASVYNAHLRGPVTLTPIAECLALELPVPVFTT